MKIRQMLGVKRIGYSQWRKIGGWDWHDEANKSEYTGSIPKTIRKKIPTLLGQICSKRPIYNYKTRTVRLGPWLYKITFRQGDSSNYGDVYKRSSLLARFLWFIGSLTHKKIIYLISDTHFDHANIIKYCNRPYGNVREMNRALTINWNSVVRPRDTVYFLGGWSFGRRSRPPKYWIRRLNGHIISIKGSHDRSIRGIRLHERKVICYGKHRFLRWSPKFGQVAKSGFCSYNEYGIGGEHETEPKKAQPIVQSQGSPGSIKR